MNKINTLFLIIRSGSVTGLLSYYDKSEIPQFIEIKKDIIFDNNLKYKNFDKESYKVLEEVMFQLIKPDIPLPEKTIIIYSSPWFNSQISEYEIPNSSKGFKYKNLDSVLKDASDLDDNVFLINQRVESISLNGYRTNSPEGKKYEEGSVTLLTSWMDKTIKDKFESVIKRFLNDREIEHITLPSVLNTVISSHNPSYHILDIHGESTDIINIQDDSIDSTGSIPFGVHHLIRSIKKDSQGYVESYEEFLHIIKNIKDPIVHREEKDKIKKGLLNWAEMLSNVPDFTDNNNIILLSQNNTDKLYKDALENSNGGHNTNIMILNKEYFNSQGSNLSLNSIIVISFWNIFNKNVVKLGKK